MNKADENKIFCGIDGCNHTAGFAINASRQVKQPYYNHLKDKHHISAHGIACTEGGCNVEFKGERVGHEFLAHLQHQHHRTLVTDPYHRPPVTKGEVALNHCANFFSFVCCGDICFRTVVLTLLTIVLLFLYFGRNKETDNNIIQNFNGLFGDNVLTFGNGSAGIISQSTIDTTSKNLFCLFGWC